MTSYTYCSKFLIAVPTDIYYNDPADVGTSMTVTFSVKTCDGNLMSVTAVTYLYGVTISDPYISSSGSSLTINIPSSAAFDPYIGSLGV